MAKRFNTDIVGIPPAARGSMIRMCRIGRGMSQAKLAEKLGIGIESISQYERGIRNPATERFCEIMRALEIKVLLVTPWPISEKKTEDSTI